MSQTLYERHHKAIGSFPYIGLDEKNMNYMSHYHEELEVVYTLKGSWTAITSSCEYELVCGDICIFMPGEIHSLKSTDPNEIYVFKINPKSYKEIFEFERIRLSTNKISQSDHGYEDLKNAVLAMAGEYTEKKPGYEFAIRSAKNSIITTLLRELEYKYIDTSNNLRLFNRINLYLENNYSQQISLEDIGALCHLSKYYFAHEFKRLTGISFMNYLTSFRLEKAIEMLMFSHESMTDIAMRCGFGNVRSFNRKFKESYGKTPLEYKKSLNKT